MNTSRLNDYYILNNHDSIKYIYLKDLFYVTLLIHQNVFEQLLLNPEYSQYLDCYYKVNIYIEYYLYIIH